jgi:MFS family permease
VRRIRRHSRPYPQTELDAPLATVQWVATGYTLALCAATPLAAWAMSRFRAKRAYLTALAPFTGGSAASHPGRSPA